MRADRPAPTSGWNRHIAVVGTRDTQDRLMARTRQFWVPPTAAPSWLPRSMSEAGLQQNWSEATYALGRLLPLQKVGR
jgi:hypothetical protein